MNPVLCLDTCTVLDILRDPRRVSVRVNDHTACISLLGAAEANQLDVFLTHVVRTEFGDHVEDVEREAQRGLDAITDDISKVDALATLHGSPGVTDIRHWHGHVGRCRQVAERWLEVGQDAVQSTAVESRALARVLQGRTPSRRGKDSTKDCLILETYLAHVDTARQAGLKESVVFVSSNTKDYARSAGGLPKDIADDFAALDMEYAPNMAAAKALIDVAASRRDAPLPASTTSR